MTSAIEPHGPPHVERHPWMWAKMAEAWPDHDPYRRTTHREIPVVEQS